MNQSHILIPKYIDEWEFTPLSFPTDTKKVSYELAQKIVVLSKRVVGNYIYFFVDRSYWSDHDGEVMVWLEWNNITSSVMDSGAKSFSVVNILLKDTLTRKKEKEIVTYIAINLRICSFTIHVTCWFTDQLRYLLIHNLDNYQLTIYLR